MYTIVVILGLVCAFATVLLLKHENNDRTDKFRKILGDAGVGVYDGDDLVTCKLCKVYPIRTVHMTCGRQHKKSRIKTDIVAPSEDGAIKENAAMFYYKKGMYYIQPRSQKEIWIKETDGDVFLLKKTNNKTSGETSEVEMVEKSDITAIPQCFRDYVDSNQKYAELHDAEKRLHFGDLILMGNTLFEYNEWGVLREKYEAQQR